MSKIEELIKQKCPDGVVYKTLGELGEFMGGLTGKSKDDFSDGNAVFITYKNVYLNPALDVEPLDRVKIAEDENQRTLEYGDVIFTGSSETPDECGISSVVTKHPIKKLYLNSFCFVFRFNDLSVIEPNFAKHLFRSHDLRCQISKTAAGVTRFNVSKDKMRKVIIPVPPVGVQQEIACVLDKFTELETELQAELDARKKQYEFYRDKLMAFGENEVEWKRLDEVFSFIRNGFVGTVSSFFTDAENGIRYLEGTNIHNGIISDNEVLYVTKEFHQKHIRNELKSDDVLMVQSGHIGECAMVGKKYKGANCHALIIMSNGGEVLSKFYVHYFHSFKGFCSLTPAVTGGTIKHVLAGKVGNIKVPVPTAERQKDIVNILDKFEQYCLDEQNGLPAEIEARHKQYEYYRDKLLTFKRKEA